MASFVNKFSKLKEIDYQLNGTVNFQKIENKPTTPHNIMKNRSLIITPNVNSNEMDIINSVLKSSKYKIRESILLDVRG